MAFLTHDWNFLIMQIKPQRSCSKHKECNAGNAQCERIELKQDQSKNNTYCCDLNQQYESDCLTRGGIIFKYHARPSLFPLSAVWLGFKRSANVTGMRTRRKR